MVPPCLYRISIPLHLMITESPFPIKGHSKLVFRFVFLSDVSTHSHLPLLFQAFLRRRSLSSSTILLVFSTLSFYIDKPVSGSSLQSRLYQLFLFCQDIFLLSFHCIDRPPLSWYDNKDLNIRASTGFDRDHEAGEAIRMRCVKWQT